MTNLTTNLTTKVDLVTRAMDYVNSWFDTYTNFVPGVDTYGDLKEAVLLDLNTASPLYGYVDYIMSQVLNESHLTSDATAYNPDYAYDFYGALSKVTGFHSKITFTDYAEDLVETMN